MSDTASLCQRLGEALAAHDETTLALQGLADELVDHCSRMRALTNKLRGPKQTLDSINGGMSEPLRLPNALAGGPKKRPEA